jgi:hypothetical protein
MAKMLAPPFIRECGQMPILLQAMVLDTGGIDIPAKMARLYA